MSLGTRLAGDDPSPAGADEATEAVCDEAADDDAVCDAATEPDPDVAALAAPEAEELTTTAELAALLVVLAPPELVEAVPPPEHAARASAAVKIAANPARFIAFPLIATVGGCRRTRPEVSSLLGQADSHASRVARGFARPPDPG
jgi:hypothetical protein